MRITPIATGMLTAGSDLLRILQTSLPRDRSSAVLVISSKAIATVEGETKDLERIQASARALDYAKKTGRSAEFMEAVLQELKRLKGTVRGYCPGALLTEVSPPGMPQGTIFTANAGLDESNTPEATAIGWPQDPVASARTFWLQLGLPVIISDSNCVPRRLGVTAVALACAGMDPITSFVGEKDLFGKTLSVTQEATADQLATAANIIMGNADQGAPAALIEEAVIIRSDFAGWVGGIEPADDLFAGAFGDQM